MSTGDLPLVFSKMPPLPPAEVEELLCPSRGDFIRNTLYNGDRLKRDDQRTDSDQCCIMVIPTKMNLTIELQHKFK